MAPSATKSLQQQQQQQQQHLPLLQVHCEALLCAALEHWAHHLLYVRRVYPRDCFTKSVFVGVKGCRVCRHPAVVSYITNSIQTAVPAMMLCGENNNSNNSSSNCRSDNVALSLTILDNDDDHEGDNQSQIERETYTLRVLEMLSQEEWKDYDAACSRKSSNNNSNGAAAAAAHYSHNDLIYLMERKLRDLVLHVHGLESSKTGSPSLPWTNRVTFRISLFLPQRFMSQNKQMLNKRCSSLLQNLADGTWRTTTNSNQAMENDNDDDSSASTYTNARVLRPLHRMSTPLWRMDFSLQYHKQHQKQGKRRRGAKRSVAALLPRPNENENDNDTVTA